MRISDVSSDVCSADLPVRSEQVTRPAPQHENEDVLIADYVESHTPAIRDRVVVACTPLVRRIAAEFVFSGVPSDDLVQVGYIGLLNAIAAFDPRYEERRLWKGAVST